MLDALQVQDLKAKLRGQVIEPKDANYEAARSLYNGMIDKRPLLIAQCANAADVMTAVNFGRENSLPITIRCGGHNGPGLGIVNDGLVIDLSMMKGVRVDPVTRTARVDAAARRATSITPPMPSGWPYLRASFRPLASRA